MVFKLRLDEIGQIRSISLASTIPLSSHLQKLAVFEMRHRACVRDSRRLQHSMLLASLLISSATAFLHVPKAPLDIKFRMRSAEEFGTQNSLLSVAVPKLSGASQLHQRRPVARSEQGWTVLFASSSDDTPQNRTQAAEAAELPAEQQKGKKRTPTSQKIGRVKMLLQAAVVSLYLGSTLYAPCCLPMPLPLPLPVLFLSA